MKRYFRPVAYSVIAGLLALALLGETPADTPAFVKPVARQLPMPSVSPEPEPPSLVMRPQLELSAGLFASRMAPSAAASAPEPPQPSVLPPEPASEMTVFGWMVSRAQTDPYVFVSIGNEHYTLSPGESAAGAYRFERIGGGIAEFTHLPSGQPREYAVSDPTVVD